MGVMSKFKKARATGGAFKYFEEGEHICQVNQVKQFEDRNGNEAVALDAVILHTSNPTMSVGETRNWMVSEEKKDVYAPNVKGMLMAVHNMSEADLDSMTDSDFEDLCNLTFGEQQAAAGAYIKVISVKTRKKHAKNIPMEKCAPDDVYTKHAFQFIAPAGSEIEIGANGIATVKKVGAGSATAIQQ